MSWTIGSSINWDNFNQIRLYGSKPDGTLVEWVYEGGEWVSPRDLPAVADPGTPISAVCYQDDRRGTHIKVYFHSEGRVKELDFDSHEWGPITVLP